jgi:very-short-patch-repair endonuclease
MPKLKTTEDFIEESIAVHGSKYDYSKVIYTKWNVKIPIICLEHGVFWQTPSDHINGRGCAKCSGKYRYNTEEIKVVFNSIHNGRYLYDNVKYKNTNTKVFITCPEHGDFEQSPKNHLKGKGCPRCNTSKGELAVMDYLQFNDISFESQKKFNDCTVKRTLMYDFYIPSMQLLIEYDGIQHFSPIDRFGGRDTYLKTIKYDNIKDEYARNRSISLLRIPYWDFDNISNILDGYIK